MKNYARHQQNYDNQSPPEPTDSELKEKEREENIQLLCEKYERIIRHNAIETGDTIPIIKMLARLLSDVADGKSNDKIYEIADMLVLNYIQRPFIDRHLAINRLFDAAIELESKKMAEEKYPNEK